MATLPKTGSTESKTPETTTTPFQQVSKVDQVGDMNRKLYERITESRLVDAPAQNNTSTFSTGTPNFSQLGFLGGNPTDERDARVNVADYVENNYGISADEFLKDYSGWSRQLGLYGEPIQDLAILRQNKEVIDKRRARYVENYIPDEERNNLLRTGVASAVRLGMTVDRAIVLGLEQVSDLVLPESAEAVPDFLGELHKALGQVRDEDVGLYFGENPDFRGSFKGMLAEGAVQLGAQIGVTLVNPVAGIGFIGTQMYDEGISQVERSFGKSYSDMSNVEKRAAGITGTGYAVVGTLMEGIGINVITGGKLIPKAKIIERLRNAKNSPLANQLAKNITFARTTTGATRVAMDVGEAAVTEGLTEMGQGLFLDYLIDGFMKEKSQVFSSEYILEKATEFWLGAILGGTARIPFSVLEGRGQRPAAPQTPQTPQTPDIYGEVQNDIILENLQDVPETTQGSMEQIDQTVEGTSIDFDSLPFLTPTSTVFNQGQRVIPEVLGRGTYNRTRRSRFEREEEVLPEGEQGTLDPLLRQEEINRTGTPAQISAAEARATVRGRTSDQRQKIHQRIAQYIDPFISSTALTWKNVADIFTPQEIVDYLSNYYNSEVVKKGLSILRAIKTNDSDTPDLIEQFNELAANIDNIRNIDTPEVISEGLQDRLIDIYLDTDDGKEFVEYINRPIPLEEKPKPRFAVISEDDRKIFEEDGLLDEAGNLLYNEWNEDELGPFDDEEEEGPRLNAAFGPIDEGRSEQTVFKLNDAKANPEKFFRPIGAWGESGTYEILVPIGQYEVGDIISMKQIKESGIVLPETMTDPYKYPENFDQPSLKDVTAENFFDYFFVEGTFLNGLTLEETIAELREIFEDPSKSDLDAISLTPKVKFQEFEIANSTGMTLRQLIDSGMTLPDFTLIDPEVMQDMGRGDQFQASLFGRAKKLQAKIDQEYREDRDAAVIELVKMYKSLGRLIRRVPKKVTLRTLRDELINKLGWSQDRADAWARRMMTIEEGNNKANQGLVNRDFEEALESIIFGSTSKQVTPLDATSQETRFNYVKKVKRHIAEVYFGASPIDVAHELTHQAIETMLEMNEITFDQLAEAKAEYERITGHITHKGNDEGSVHEWAATMGSAWFMDTLDRTQKAGIEQTLPEKIWAWFRWVKDMFENVMDMSINIRRLKDQGEFNPVLERIFVQALGFDKAEADVIYEQALAKQKPSLKQTRQNIPSFVQFEGDDFIGGATNEQDLLDYFDGIFEYLIAEEDNGKSVFVAKEHNKDLNISKGVEYNEQEIRDRGVYVPQQYRRQNRGRLSLFGPEQEKAMEMQFLGVFEPTGATQKQGRYNAFRAKNDIPAKDIIKDVIYNEEDLIERKVYVPQSQRRIIDDGGEFEDMRLSVGEEETPKATRNERKVLRMRRKMLDRLDAIMKELFDGNTQGDFNVSFETVRGAIKSLEKMVRILPVEFRGRFRGYFKLAGNEKTKPTTRLAALKRAAARIKAIYNFKTGQLLKKDIINKVKDLNVKLKLDTKVGDIGRIFDILSRIDNKFEKRGFDSQTKEVVDYMEELNKTPSEQLTPDEIFVRDLMNLSYGIRKKGAYFSNVAPERQIAQSEEAFNEIVSAYELIDTRLRDVNERRRTRLEEIRDEQAKTRKDAAAVIRGDKAVKSAQERRADENRATNLFQETLKDTALKVGEAGKKTGQHVLKRAKDFFVFGQYGLEQMMNYIDPTGGLREKFYLPVLKADQDEQTANRVDIREYVRRVDEIFANTTGGIKSKLNRIGQWKEVIHKTGLYFSQTGKKDKNGNAIGVKEQPMTIMQAISLLNALKDKTLRNTWIAMGITKRYDNDVLYDGKVSKQEEALTNKWLKYSDMVIDRLYDPNRKAELKKLTDKIVKADLSLTESTMLAIQLNKIPVLRKARELIREESITDIDFLEATKEIDEMVEIYIRNIEAIKASIIIRQDNEIQDFQKQVQDFIRNNGGEEALSYGEVLMEIYAEKGVEVRDAYREIEGEELHMIDNYGGRIYRIGLDLTAEDNIPDNITQIEHLFYIGDNQRPSAKNASLKERIENDHPLEFRDADEEIIRHMNDMNHYITHGEIARDLRATFMYSDEVREAIRDVHGDDVLGMIETMVAHIIAGRVEIARVNDIWSSVRRNFAVGSIGLKIPVMLKQFMSIPAYMNEMPVKEYAKYMKEFFSNFRGNWTHLRNSDYLKNRISSTYDRDVSELMARMDNILADDNNLNPLKNFNAKSKRSWVNLFMAATRFGDASAIIIGGWAVYKYNKDQALKAGKTEQEAEAIGMQKFVEATERSQQSGNIHALGHHQRQNNFTKLFTMFMTAPIQYNRQVTMAITKTINTLKNKKLSKEEKIAALQDVGKTIAIFHFVLPMLFQAMSSAFIGLWSDDEEVNANFWKNMMRSALLGNFNSFFILGDALEGVANKMTERVAENIFDVDLKSDFFINDIGSAPVFSGAEQLLGAVNSLMSEKKEDGQQMEALLKLLTEGATISGIPVEAISTQLGGIGAAIGNKTDAPLPRLLGFTEYSLGVEDEE